ncbi:pyridoxamine 5'-phosphate oxidase family protein [Granulicella paludicola]|uniref:pyridoxamine 5'-phosphate oxidase family protein n=1 Tax=Granulicella paludicola TaxID=474951 RepID=UPI0021E05D4D|nr:pyridoxamine 5'-phosphate oxidase family protein [Granulicella paludicola]
MSEKNDHDSEYKELSGAEGTKKIGEMIGDIHIAMMTTVAKDGSMSSRPMAVQDTPFDGTLWFLTKKSSEKIEEVEADQHVTLTFAEPKDSEYLALKGRANISSDRTKIKELWNPLYKAWFPKGEDDPDIAVVKVDVVEGDYWEATSGKIVMLVKYAAAAATGGKVPVGEAGHITV